jgi:hypothetical protein
MSLEKKSIREAFRTAVFQRDGYRCVICNSPDHINAHHITNRDEMKDGGYSVDNGITLCWKCHLLAEKFYPNNLYLMIGSKLAEPAFDLLSEVRRYIATATREQVAKDLLASDFEEYRGIGESITAETIASQEAYKKLEG